MGPYGPTAGPVGSGRARAGLKGCGLRSTSWAEGQRTSENLAERSCGPQKKGKRKFLFIFRKHFVKKNNLGIAR
jgi:hypothetical protein